MHDITEGGVLGAVWEICQNAELGCEIDIDLVPVLESTKKICDHFGIDYLKLISSGSMLIIADKNLGESILFELRTQNIKAGIIGKLTDTTSDRDAGSKEIGNCFLVANGEKQLIMPPESDHIYLIK
jgi:hydrogenase expression/formation protein HypE